MYPWLDRRGQFSPFKTLVLMGLLLPAGSIAVDYWQGDLGARPITEAIHQAGFWAIRLLFVSLAVTPFRQALQWPKLILVRRMIGVAAFAYAALHLTLYAADQMFDLAKVASEIVLRIYLTIGFVALLCLAALAVTSTDSMIRRLGGKRWRRLHQASYAIGLLASLHFFLQAKANITEPLVMAGFFAWLMGYRLLVPFGARAGAPAVWAMAALGLVSTAGSALGEAGYFWASRGVNPALILAADLSWDAGTRPAWIVLGATLLLLLAIAFRRLQQSGFWQRARPAIAGGA